MPLSPSPTLLSESLESLIQFNKWLDKIYKLKTWETIKIICDVGTHLKILIKPSIPVNRTYDNLQNRSCRVYYQLTSLKFIINNKLIQEAGSEIINYELIDFGQQLLCTLEKFN